LAITSIAIGPELDLPEGLEGLLSCFVEDDDLNRERATR
jgi:hypothetical protein